METSIYDTMLQDQHIGQALMREAEGFKHTIASETLRIENVAHFLTEAVKDGNWRSADEYVHLLIQQANQLRRFTAFVASTSYYEKSYYDKKS
jgi:hypothetical protein